MVRYAHFDEIKSGVAFTDPWYKEDVWCQYRNAFQDRNWYMKLDAKINNYSGFNILDFQMIFGRPTFAGSTRLQEEKEGTSTFTSMRYEVDSVELGIDSAQIFCGSLSDLNVFGESTAFHTGGDGMFGELLVCTVKGDSKPAGFVLFCSFDPEFMTEEQFFNHLVSSFGGKEISEKTYLHEVSPNNIKNRIMAVAENNKAAGLEPESPSANPHQKDPER